jgi:stage II sporulation protein D
MLRAMPFAAFVLIAVSGCNRPSPPPPARTPPPVESLPPLVTPPSSEALHASAYGVFELTRAAGASALGTAASGEARLTAGRRLAVHLPEWLDAEATPGSIAKLATLAEALRRGAIDADTRIACTRRVTLEGGRHADCSHPVLSRPLTTAEAIGHSCNVFAATVARRLTRAQLSGGLVALGFAPIGPSDDPVAAALGLGEGRVRGSRLVDVLLRALEGPPVIRDGLALAADGGTASAFARVGVSAFAKTGTSRMRNGRSLGLTVAAAPRSEPTRAVVVLLQGGNGADAADVAARLLRSFTRPHQERVRVGRARSNGGHDSVDVDLEDYVAEVVAGETPGETPAAAREALAVAARTFALANRGRHRADGFDLCALTHCQVVRPADPGALRAAQATTGRVLRANRRVTPVFYSAECGGVLDDASAVAGDVASIRDLPWTRARPDPAGADEPEWSTVLDAAPLDALFRRAGFRGSSLGAVRVEANAAGRVRRIHVEGVAPSSMSIDDFRRLVGHDLGWGIVRSTRFEVHRTSRGYELRGRGHGHGVGLCVFGASRLARAGSTADAILAAYFPGLAVAGPSTGVRLHLPAASESERAMLTAFVERTLGSLVSAAGTTAPASLDVVVHPTVESYGRATRRAWWTAAATRVLDGQWTIDTIPLESLRTGGRLETTLRHELAHVLIDSRLDGRPLWVREGLAMHFAGEGAPRLDGPCPTDAEFRAATTRDAMAAVYRRAASCVSRALSAGVAWTEMGKGGDRESQRLPRG